MSEAMRLMMMLAVWPTMLNILGMAFLTLSLKFSLTR